MKKLIQFLTSMPFMGFLLLVMAFSMAIATFTESSWGTEAAKALVYNTRWFEVVFLLLGISLVTNFIRYRMYLPQKLPVGIFHLSFILIVFGAAITRYISFEGVMHIREGQSSDYIMSTDTYFKVETGDKKIREQVLFSELTHGQFHETFDLDGQRVKIKSVGFVKNALRTPVEHPAGSPMVDFVISAGQGMQSFSFGPGDQFDLGAAKVGFNNDANIRFEQEGDELYLLADRDMEIRSMGGGEPEPVQAGVRSPVKMMHLYAFDNYLLLVRKFYPKALIRVTRDASGNSHEDAVILEVSEGGRVSTVNVFGRSGTAGEPVTFKAGNTNLRLSYGSEPIYLPFKLYLKDFQLERYIGSESPSSYASEIKLIDEQEGVERDVRIFMNNTLKYRGYRFYQSSYDVDELGTVLSVNKDFWGTFVTYLGYLLMALGMIFSLFYKHSYFQFLVRHLKELNKFKVTAALAFLLLLSGQAQGNNAAVSGIPSLDAQLVSDFSELWVHGRDGRIEPMSTLSNEILRKVSRKSSFYGKSADEVVLSMHLYPEIWRTVPMIKVDREVAAFLGIQGKYAAAVDFFDMSGHYKLAEPAQAAYNKMPGMRNQKEKEFLYTDERVNICFMVFNGEFFTFFPPKNPTEAWFFAGSKPDGYPRADSLFVNRSFQLLRESLLPGSDVQPRQILATVASFQEKFGAEILPPAQKKSAELTYNKIQPFKRVFSWYLLTGFILLTVLFVNIFRQKPAGKLVIRMFVGLIFFGFLLHTGGLILRWYISGHAPWSNGYESMVYVAWAAMLSGFIFGRKYPLVLGTAAFLSGITLFVAHLNWMNPEITPLVPVLKSYWLIIHVAIITASYGFIGLSAFVGLLVLTLYGLMKERNRENVNHYIDQLTTISELSATIGLYMLTIGTFLGGVWANESWGRYWGWDPKETWALITVMIYAFVVHMRLIPSLRGRFNYNLATVIGFSSVLMTYFGVNYFLSGMHSYGKGSVDGIHWAVYVSLVLVAGLITFSYLNYKKFEGADRSA
ncbi:c-type cytochrome biogenesis protein CcsB [Gaoshiqia sp. Z1-71]|uniref:c-type cytochrome biogenesis protein CcsB n=1 Tax=Gaoshiqia hydrogeniformans TaxID=3290090 RepID=UPI003BF8377C